MNLKTRRRESADVMWCCGAFQTKHVHSVFHRTNVASQWYSKTDDFKAFLV